MRWFLWALQRLLKIGGLKWKSIKPIIELNTQLNIVFAKPIL
ncbi:hypothetical protein CEAn_00037 [Coxiella endosymbiont of Amblyomma nuttalli]|nr:hypothetical protein CEAn_00037 [Coxiella endosymbiont of Amblyomma nuttalli]